MGRERRKEGWPQTGQSEKARGNVEAMRRWQRGNKLVKEKRRCLHFQISNSNLATHMILQVILAHGLGTHKRQGKTEVTIVRVVCRENTKGIPSSRLLYTDTLLPLCVSEFFTFSPSSSYSHPQTAVTNSTEWPKTFRGGTRNLTDGHTFRRGRTGKQKGQDR